MVVGSLGFLSSCASLQWRIPLLQRYAPTAWPHGGGVYSAWKIHCRETVDDEYGVDLDEGQ